MRKRNGGFGLSQRKEGGGRSVRRFWVLLLVLCFVLLSGCGGGSDSSYVARVRIVDNEGNPIAGVQLVLDGGSAGEFETTEHGEWSGRVRGVVTITLEKPGYAFESRQVQVTKEKPQANIRGVTGKVIGGVVINGRPPDKKVRLEIYGGEEVIHMLTEDTGEFKVPLSEIIHPSIVIAAIAEDSFTEEERVQYGLASWSVISGIPSEAAFLPAIDLYSYGFGMEKPAEDETISA